MNPLLRGLDDRGSAEVLAASRIVALRDGEPLYRAGEPADELFVVLEGVLCESNANGTASIGLRLSSPRRLTAGDLVGEEAALGGSATRVRAVGAEGGPARVFGVPMHTLRRAAARAHVGDRSWLKSLERTLRRNAARALLDAIGFDPDGRDAPLLDAARVRSYRRGDRVASAGEPAGEVFLVGDGMLRLVRNVEHASPRASGALLERHAERGAIVGTSARNFEHDVVCELSGWVLVVPRAMGERLLGDPAPRPSPPGRATPMPTPTATPTATSDRTEAPPRLGRDIANDPEARADDERGRIRIARSLPLIDTSSCVHCGRCASACASAHDDGLVRLVRKGPVVAFGNAPHTPWLVVESCHHCRAPACLTDCPAFAIARDAEGVVRIDPARCTGCGACAKACPWGNIAMADTAQGGSVAVKCDRCDSLDAGPACVRACPTESFVRLDGEAVLVDGAVKRDDAATPAAGALARSALSLSAACGAFAAARWLGPRAAGFLLLGAMLYLVSHAAATRLLPRRGGRTSPLVRTHTLVGAAAVGLAVAHAAHGTGTPLTNALAVTLAVAFATGGLLVAFRALFPRRIAALGGGTIDGDRGAFEPPSHAVFRALHGRPDAVKRIYELRLRRYAESRVGAVRDALLAAPRAREREELRLQRFLREALGPDTYARLGDVEQLIGAVVATRSARAQRCLTGALRGMMVAHAVTSAAAVALSLAHVGARLLAR